MDFDISEQILEVCKRLHARNMLAAADGNISYRIDNQNILITPTGVPKAFMEIRDMALITLDNQIRHGKPSGERLIHLEVYKRCPDAKAVVHAHPPHAIAWSLSHPELEELPCEGLSEIILACGKIPFVKYARPGTQNMADVLTPFLPKHRALILSNHGAITWGESLLEAYMGMERIEHSAIILKTARDLGPIQNLPEEEVNALKQMRLTLGDRIL